MLLNLLMFCGGLTLVTLRCQCGGTSHALDSVTRGVLPCKGNPTDTAS